MPSLGAILKTLVVFALCIATSSSFPTSTPAGDIGKKREGDCDNPPIRREWRTLTDTEKADYIQAVKCLQGRPAIATALIPAAVNRFDDFQGVHIMQTFSIHFVGHFLAWHRYYVATYEKALREECNYTGGQPYWDWTLDASDFLSSPLWDPATGFGGNGTPEPADPTSIQVPGASGGGCITDGPFVDFRLHLGPGSSLNRTDRCLRRSFSPAIASNFSNSEKVQYALAQGDFGWFDKVVEGETNFVNVGIHGAGHYSIGGEAGDLYASPGEPAFYLHHSNLDRIYWLWQSQNLTARLSDVSGPVELLGPITGPNVTLDFEIELGPLAEKTTIHELMNIRGHGEGGVLCYDYD